MRKTEPKEPYIDFRKVKKGLPKNFEALVREYRDCQDAEKAAEKRRKEIGESLAAIMIGAKQTRLEVDSLWVGRFRGRTAARIDGKKLLSRGIPSTVIVECTIQGVEYDYVKIINREEAGSELVSGA